MILSIEKPGSPEEVLEYLEHHGIKGMQWGVRKKEETSSNKSSIKSKPLSEKKERSAKQHEHFAKLQQNQIDIIKKAPPSKIPFVQMHRNNQIKELQKQRDINSKAAKDIREGHMTDRQKKILIGTGVAVGILAAYGTYKYIDSGAAQQMFGSADTFLKKNDLLRRHMSAEDIMKDVVKPINPEFGDLGTKMNCRRCTFAYEMRRRGYDVKATNTVGASGQTVSGLLNATDPNSKLNTTMFGTIRASKQEGSPVHTALKTSQGLGKEGIDLKSAMYFGRPNPTPDQEFVDAIMRRHRIAPDASEKSQAIFNAIGKHPDKARGELGLMWKMGGAHSMAWENINGVPHVFDTQTGIHYTVQEFAENIGPGVQDAGLTRLDNIELNTNYLKRWVKNVA